MLGMDAATSEQIFQNVKAIKISADVSGAIASPTVKVDAGKTLAGLKDAMVAAGKAQLANMAGDQLKKVLPDGIPGLSTSNPADILKGVGDLLKKKDGDDKDGASKNPLDLLKRATKGDDENTDKDTEKKDPVGGLLERL
jgi:hypothetical protein